MNTACSINSRSTVTGAGRRTNDRKPRSSERGAVAIEFVLVLPLLALAMLLILGMHIVIKKNHALVAARFSTQYQTVYSSDPSSQKIARSVGSPRDQWTLNSNRSAADEDAQGEINGGTRGSDGIGFASVLSGILNFVGGNNKLEDTASTGSFGGVIAKFRRPDDAKAKYVVEHNTWICKGTDGNSSGSYLSMLVSQIPFVGGFMSNFFDLSCCETYNATKD